MRGLINKSVIYKTIQILAKVSVNEIIGGLSIRTLAYVVSHLLFYELSEFHLTGHKFGRSCCNSGFLYREKQMFQ